MTGNVNGNFPVNNILVSPRFAPMCNRLNAAFNNGRLTYATTLTILSIFRGRGLMRGTRRINRCLVTRLGRLRGHGDRVARIHNHNLVMNTMLSVPRGRIHDGLVRRRRYFANYTNAGVLHVLPPLMLAGRGISSFVKELRAMLGRMWAR